MSTIYSPELHFLPRPAGRLAYTVDGAGPLVVAVPGMGDLRSAYRELVGPLRETGYRVAVMDLRGHGDSDTTFHEHGDVVTAGDILALIDELGGPAVIVGNSMAGTAAVIAAADRPDAVAGLVLYSPFLREALSRGAMSATRFLYRILFARPWGAAIWANYYAKTLNRSTAAPWLPEQVAAIRSAMQQPGRLRSFRELTVQLDHSPVESVVASVAAPALIVVGDRDPDYRDPAAELVAMGAALGAETFLVDSAAHYPHAQRPELVVPRTLAFLEGLRDGSGWGSPRA